MSDQKKLRRLNEALRFLTDKKLKTWQDGGRKGKIFNIAIQAFQKNGLGIVLISLKYMF